MIAFRLVNVFTVRYYFVYSTINVIMKQDEIVLFLKLVLCIGNYYTHHTQDV